eukprot:jgi/Mesen1/453/ME000101S10682
MESSYTSECVLGSVPHVAVIGDRKLRSQSARKLSGHKHEFSEKDQVKVPDTTEGTASVYSSDCSSLSVRQQQTPVPKERGHDHFSESPPLSELSCLMRPEDEEAELQWARDNLASPDIIFGDSFEGSCIDIGHTLDPAGVGRQDIGSQLGHYLPGHVLEFRNGRQSKQEFDACNVDEKDGIDLESELHFLKNDDGSGQDGLDDCMQNKVHGLAVEDYNTGRGVVVNVNSESPDISPCELLELPDTDLEISLDALDGEVHDTELGEDEAMLLAEITMGATEASAIMNSGAATPEVTRSISCQDSQDNFVQGGRGGKAASGKRKMKVDWTPELHRRFVQAVEQLGVEKAIPSRILELMGVQCLTRHNIASHLQKYRSHRRHLIAREAEAATWHHRRPVDPTTLTRMRRDGSPWVSLNHTNTPPIQPRPAIGLPPLQPHPPPMGHPVGHSHPPGMLPHGHHHPMGMPLLVWGHPTMDCSPAHMWQHPPVPPPAAWHGPDGSVWQYPSAPVDTWGHPPGAVHGTPCFQQQPHMRMAVAPPPSGVPAGPFSASPAAAAVATADGYFLDEALPGSMFSFGSDHGACDPGAFDGTDAANLFDDLMPPKGILDAAISEALANPFTPLPLGLKPPSMEGVMAELQRQGIVTTSTSSLPLADGGVGVDLGSGNGAGTEDAAADDFIICNNDKELAAGPM